MKHGSAATTTIFPPDRNQTKTSRRLASRSGTVDPRLDEPRDDSRVPSASAGTKQQSSVGVSDQVPALGSDYRLSHGY
jgi:hypothetical protein